VRTGAARGGRIDDAALDRLLRAAEAANSDAVVVLHDGELVGAWYAGGERRRMEAMTATRSMMAYPEDLARLGQLVLDGGRANGEQLIRESWFEQSLRPGSQHRPGVGLLWWLIRDVDPEAGGGFGSVTGYRADGILGQYLVVYPAERLVAVRMVAASPAYDPSTDTFPDFQSLVRQLVPKQPQPQQR
jgi:CubicO group peptidase (beta-lactamase class C family)